MKVSLHIKRTATARPASAILLLGHDSAALLRLCARQRLDPPPDVFAVADGYLVRLHQVLHEPLVGAIRLAQMGTNLFLPTDAELVPSLLPDEAASLCRSRGLVFLPQGRVLEFDANKPLAWASFLRPVRWLESSWQSLPKGRELAETISEIVVEDTGATPDDLLSAGGAGIAEEEPRPDDASLPKKMLGQAVGGIGQGLAWLGKSLRIESLARAGASMMGLGLSLFPRLSEKLLGKQEASLRDLLREFQEGDAEKALRRAVPLSNEAMRGSTVHGNANLPVNDLRYSLGNILSGFGGSSSVWLANVDIYAELRRQYCALAEAATKRGDFRRAAFIYGKLLGEYSLAADVLARGGLHQDAAHIYLKALRNYLAAAREFELAGDLDRALQLYRQEGEHVKAGDLLRRMGEEELAVAAFRQAADQLVDQGKGWNQAGELMLHKAQRPDLAQVYFEKGWAQRPGGSALACARHLLELHAERSDSKPLLGLVDEAQDCFEAPGQESGTSDFFNHLAKLSERPGLASIREELLDRALMILALKMRENAYAASRAQGLVPLLFPAGAPWAVNQVTDADHALKESLRTVRPDRQVHDLPTRRVVFLGATSVVRAVCQCPVTEEIFLGFENGAIACYDPGADNDKVTMLEAQSGPVCHLVCSSDAAQLIVLSEHPQDVYHLDAYERGVCWTRRTTREIGGIVGLPWIMHTLGVGAREIVGVWREVIGVHLFSSKTLLPLQSLDMASAFQSTVLALFLPPAGPGASPGMMVLDGQEIWQCTNIDTLHFEYPKLCSVALHPVGSTLSVPTIDCLPLRADEFEIVALGQGGSLAWMKKLRAGEPDLEPYLMKHAAGGFRAAALVREGLIVAVDGKCLVGLRASAAGIKEVARQPLDLENTMACFVCRSTKEVIIVDGRGTLTKVRWLPPGS